MNLHLVDTLKDIKSISISYSTSNRVSLMSSDENRISDGVDNNDTFVHDE